MRIVVTGSEGFIGRRVVAQLRARGHEVVRLDALEAQVHGWAAEMVQSAEVQVLRAGQPEVQPLLARADAVAHLGALVGVTQSQYEPGRYVDANVLDTVRLWEMARQAPTLRKLVVASSMSVYGEGLYLTPYGKASPFGLVRDRPGPGRWDAMATEHGPYDLAPLRADRTPEWKPAEPASIYAKTKLDQEVYTLLMGGLLNVPAVALRFFNTYGAGQALANPYTGALAQFACRVLNGQPPLVNEDGLQSRDFIHVADVARAVVAAIEHKDLQGTYNVCTGQPTSVLELAERWCAIAAARGLPRVAPLVRNVYRVGDVRHCFGDPIRLEHATGWRAEVPLTQGLNEMADWVQSLPEIPVDRSAEADAEAVAAGVQR